MPLQLYKLSPSKTTDVDLIPAIARVHLAAWLTNSLYKAIYYGPPSSYPGIIEANRARHMANFVSGSNSHYAVILDSTTSNASSSPGPEQVVAWVKYDVFETAEAEEQRQDTTERTWPPYTNLALVNHFWELIVRSREKHGGAIGAHVSVDLLATDPEHQRRGAGRMLMQWVTSEADRLKIPVTIEGSPEGLKLYRDVGFEPIEEFWVDLLRFQDGGDRGESWVREVNRTPGVGDGWYKQVVMVRRALG